MIGTFVEVARTLSEYWNSFGIPAYPEETVPDDATLPYITYALVKPHWRGVAIYNVRVWYKDTSFIGIMNTVDKIASDIGEGKRIIKDNVIIYLFKEDNFFQMQPLPDSEEEFKVAYLTMSIQVLAK